MTMPESPTSRRNLATMAALVAELAPLRRRYREATPSSLKVIAKTCWILEHVGATHFGQAGSPRPDVLAWHLVTTAERKGWNWLQLHSHLAQIRAERIRRA